MYIAVTYTIESIWAPQSNESHMYRNHSKFVHAYGRQARAVPKVVEISRILFKGALDLIYILKSWVSLILVVNIKITFIWWPNESKKLENPPLAASKVRNFL